MIYRFLFIILIAMTQQSWASWQELLAGAGMPQQVITYIQNNPQTTHQELGKLDHTVKALAPEEQAQFWGATHSGQKYVHKKTHTLADYERKLAELEGFGIDLKAAQLSLHYQYIISQVDPDAPRVDHSKHVMPALAENEGLFRVLVLQGPVALLKCERQQVFGGMPPEGTLVRMLLSSIQSPEPLRVDMNLVYKAGQYHWNASYHLRQLVVDRIAN